MRGQHFFVYNTFLPVFLAGATPSCHINQAAMLELNSGIMQTLSSLCSWAYSLVVLLDCINTQLCMPLCDGCVTTTTTTLSNTSWITFLKNWCKDV